MSDVTAPPSAPPTVIPMTDEPDTDAQLRERLLTQIRAAAGSNALERLPRKLSPSRASEFKQCPQKFFYKTICGIETPSSAAALRGSLAHVAFERIFDHPQGERTADIAVTYIAPAWEAMLNPDLEAMDSDSDRERAVRAAAQAAEAVAPGTPEAEQLLRDAEACVRSWFEMERVNNFSPTDLELPDGTKIDGRELYVLAELTGVDIHGYIDRLDRYETSTGEVCWSISDYKTSAVAPWLKKPYPAHVVERIKFDSFFQLRLYAAALWLMFGIPVGMLRLVYVATGDREDGIGTQYVTQQMIEQTIAELEKLWADINTSARTGRWDAKKGQLCNWCYFQDVCPAFAPDASADVTDLLLRSSS